MKHINKRDLFLFFCFFACYEPKLEVTDFIYFFHTPFSYCCCAGKLSASYCFLRPLTIVSFFRLLRKLHSCIPEMKLSGRLWRVVDEPVRAFEPPAIQFWCIRGKYSCTHTHTGLHTAGLFHWGGSFVESNHYLSVSAPLVNNILWLWAVCLVCMCVCVCTDMCVCVCSIFNELNPF